MATLMDWGFINGGHYHLMGIVTGHPKLTDGMDIATSYVESVIRQDNSVVVRTKTGTIYNLELAEIGMDKEVVYDTIAVLKSFGFDENIIIEAQVLRERKGVEYLSNADRILENGELLLCMAGTNTVRAYFKFCNKVEQCQIHVHTGMHQDSILIEIMGKVDFRYFPMPNSCEVYHWSDGLKSVKIANIGITQTVFDGRGSVLVIKKGEMKALEKKIFANEGLFSPDCVNGKSIMTGSFLYNSSIGNSKKEG